MSSRSTDDKGVQRKVMGAGAGRPHALLTGASSGIGRALAAELAAAGFALSLVARSGERLREVAAELDCPTLVVERDLAIPSAVGEWLPGVVREMGPVDLLVNNAGVAPVSPYGELALEQERSALGVNLLAPLELVRSVLPDMLARGSGTIVNVTSIAALLPTPYMNVYNAGKAGLAAFSESLGAEVRERGVAVVTIYPGVIDTPLAQAGYDAFGGARRVRAMPRATPPAIAHRIRLAIERRSKRLIYPSLYKFAWWLPWLARPLLERALPRPVRSTTSDSAIRLG